MSMILWWDNIPGRTLNIDDIIHVTSWESLKENLSKKIDIFLIHFSNIDLRNDDQKKTLLNICLYKQSSWFFYKVGDSKIDIECLQENVLEELQFPSKMYGQKNGWQTLLWIDIENFFIQYINNPCLIKHKLMI